MYTGPYRSVDAFVRGLENAGELVRITEPVSAVLDIAACADLVSKAPAPRQPAEATRQNDPEWCGIGGPALLFERVEGSDMPVLINAFGSYTRIEMALGCELGVIAETIGTLSKPEVPRSLGEAIAKLRQFAPLAKIGPKRSRRAGACQAVIETGDDVDLTRIPILRCWPLDGDFEAVGYPGGLNDGVPGLGHPTIERNAWEAGYRGRFITLAGVHTIHADDVGEAKPKSHNIGMYRVQLLGKNRLAMHWHMHHDGASHWRSWKRRGERMPVAIALGGESVLPYAATCPLPPGISELLMAGFLNGSGVRLCRAKTVPLWVPAEAEIVIEGYVSTEAGYPGWDPRETDEPLGPGAVFEGPFGDHTGFYSMPDRYPIVEVTAVTRRERAVYPATVVGLPPQEDYFLGKATERIMRPLLQTLIHDIVDYDLPLFGAFHNCAFVRIHKAYPLQARRVMHAIWGAGQMAWTKTLFIVDDDVGVHDRTAVLAACARWCRPDRDIEMVNGPLDILDHAAPRLGAGMKIGFDCTRKWAGEEVGGLPVVGHDESLDWATSDVLRGHLDRVRAIEGVLDAAAPAGAPGWLFVRVDRDVNEPDRAGLGWRVCEAVLAIDPAADGAQGVLPFVVVVGRSVDVADADAAMFHWAANCDASRDMQRVAGPHGGRIGFDATPKTAADEQHGQPVRAWPPVLSFPDDVVTRARGVLERADVRL